MMIIRFLLPGYPRDGAPLPLISGFSAFATSLQLLLDGGGAVVCRVTVADMVRHVSPKSWINKGAKAKQDCKTGSLIFKSRTAC